MLVPGADLVQPKHASTTGYQGIVKLSCDWQF